MAAALLTYFLAATLLILAPGPDTMLVMRNTLRGGRRRGMFTSLGTVTGLFCWAVAAGLGLSAVLAASRAGYDVLRTMGAVYLLWLGLSSLSPGLRARLRRGGRRSPPFPPGPTASSAAVQRDLPLGPWRAYLNGTISNLCNPKIGVFFIAFLPTFIPAGASVREMSFALGLAFGIETGLWLFVFVWLVNRGVGWFNRPVVRRRLEQFTGLVLIGFGARLATQRR
jgi:threonine/homoserine/homoserine lactone efflux protein